MKSQDLKCSTKCLPTNPCVIGIFEIPFQVFSYDSYSRDETRPMCSQLELTKLLYYVLHISLYFLNFCYF